MDDGVFYPYIHLDIDSELTAIVGANESGKSQLLQAVEYALGIGIPAPGDFCRYSDFFTVAEAMRIPHFGLQFDNLTANESQAILGILGSSDSSAISSFRVFRTSADKATLYIDEQAHEVTDLPALANTLPRVFRIDPHRAIPNSVPISFLVTARGVEHAELGMSRTDRWKVISPIVDRASEIRAQLQDSSALASIQSKSKC